MAITAETIRRSGRLARGHALARRLLLQRRGGDWGVLGVLALVQWGAVAAVALTVPHDGWLFYRVGEARPSGPVTAALPAIVLLQVLLLQPLTLVLVHRVGRCLSGRVFAVWASVLWVAIPYLGLFYANHGFRHAYSADFLPRALGLTADPAFPAMVSFLAAAFLCLRSLETAAGRDVIAGCVAATAGVAFVPRAAEFVAAPLVALAVARRWRLLRVAALTLAPLLAFVGLAGTLGLLAGPGFGHVSVSSLGHVLASLGERFWSARLLEWLAVAGAVGALRGSLTVGALIAVWFVALALTSGNDHTGTAQLIAFLRAMVPALPAFALLVAALPLLFPRARAATDRGGTARDIRKAAIDRFAAMRLWLEAHPGAIPLPLLRPAATDTAGARAVVTPLWARAALAAAFALILFVGIWNASRYPVRAGYDAREHITYADGLIHHGRIPGRAKGGEYYTPPGYYALAGAASWIGTLVGMAPHHGAQYLNVVFVVATAALLLVLAQLVFPRRPGIWIAALVFFALVPVVPKTAAMFHPETLNMLVSTAALTLATWMLLRRRFELRWLALLGLALGAGQLVRASSLFTFIAIAVAFAAAFAFGRYRRHMPLRTIAIAVAGVVIVTSPWYVRQALKYKTQPVVALPNFVDQILHPGQSSPGKRAPFLALARHDVFELPFRPHYANEAIPETYTEIWGDWFGSFSWSGYSAGPWTKALGVMRTQNVIGLLPTVLAFAGWVGLWIVLVRRRGDGIPLLPLALLPVIALAAYLWKAYALARPDGDLLKASYLLMTAPVWALGFGYVVERILRSQLLRVALVAALLAVAVLDLRFVLYGVREHWLLF